MASDDKGLPKIVRRKAIPGRPTVVFGAEVKRAIAKRRAEGGDGAEGDDVGHPPPERP
jgi:hypothetical protein